MKVAFELTKEHWEKARQDNISLIQQNKMTTMMAMRVLVMIAEKLKSFPEEKPVVVPAQPAPVEPKV